MGVLVQCTQTVGPIIIHTGPRIIHTQLYLGSMHLLNTFFGGMTWEETGKPKGNHTFMVSYAATLYKIVKINTILTNGLNVS